MQLLSVSLLALVAAGAAIGWLLYARPSAARLAAVPASVGSAVKAAAVAAASSAGASKKKHKGHKAGKGGGAAAAASAAHPAPAAAPVNMLASTGSGQRAADSVASGVEPVGDPAAALTAAGAEGAGADLQPGQQRRPSQDSGGQRAVQQGGMGSGATPQRSSGLEPQGSSDASRPVPSSAGRGGGGTPVASSYDAAAPRSHVDPETGAVLIGRLRVGPAVMGYGSAGAQRVRGLRAAGRRGASGR